MSREKVFSVGVFAVLILGMLSCYVSVRGDFYENFEGPSIDLVNWTIFDYGGLDAVQANGKLYINGSYDGGETAPGTNGWNTYRLIYKDNFTGFLDISATHSTSYMLGTEFGTGICIMENQSISWDYITSWAQRFYGATNSTGWVDSWYNGSDTKVTFDPTNITVLKEYSRRMVHHENGSVQFILDGETKGWLPVYIKSFYPCLSVAVKYAGSRIEVVFDDFRLITGFPTAVLDASKTILKKKEIVTLSGNNSFYDGASIQAYYFDFGNGDTSGWVNTSYVFYNYSENGTYNVRLKVRGDNWKESDWSSLVLHVENERPIAVIDVQPATVQTFEPVTFSAIQSTDPDGEIIGYLFEPGDGTNSGWQMSSGANYVYSDDGLFSARVKVIDDDGHESNWSEPVTITVTNRPPWAHFWVSDPNIRYGGIVSFYADFSGDSDGDVTGYFFDFGDGSNSSWISSPSVDHTYLQPGEYDTRLKTRDDDGAESGWTEYTRITVSNVPPVAFLNSTTLEVEVGENVFLDGSGSYDPDGSVGGYSFDFGDGSESGWLMDSHTTHIFDQPGQYQVSLKVRDDVEEESAEEAVITITVRKETSDQTALDWAWIIVVMVLAVLLIIALFIIFAQKKRIRELEEHSEELKDKEEDLSLAEEE